MRLLQGGFHREDFLDKISDRRKTRGPDTAWTRLLYASADLRRIGMGAPGLWTCISLQWSQPWLKLCLKRSQQMPLAVIVFGDIVQYLDRQVVREAIHRAELFAADFDWRHNESANHQILEALRDAQCVRVLQLSLHEHVWGVTLDDFPGRAAQVTVLVLNSLKLFSWPSFPSLRTLHLRYVSIQSTDSLPALLETSPLLQDINIEHVTVPPYPRVGSILTIFGHPKLSSYSGPLRRLRIEDRSVDMVAILQVMPCPSQVLELNIVPDHGTETMLTWAHHLECLVHATTSSWNLGQALPLTIEFESFGWTYAYGVLDGHSFSYRKFLYLRNAKSEIDQEQVQSMLQYVTVLRMEGEELAQLRSVAWDYFVDRIPLRQIYISGYKDPAQLRGLAVWLVARRHPIDEVVFEDCGEGMKDLSYRVRNLRQVRKVVWRKCHL
jgi:hypothetical protein